MVKKNSVSNKNLAIILFIGLAIQEIIPRTWFGSLSWVGTILILIAAIILLVK